MDLPSLEEFEKNILIPELNLGDAVCLILKLYMAQLEIILLNLEEHFQ